MPDLVWRKPYSSWCKICRLCKGMRITMTSTGAKSEYVASVRYRAWQPPSALHPNLGVDTPNEEFSKEIRRYIPEKELDTNERVVITPKIIEPDPEYPHTFDLRKYKLKI